jgi:hypothetical protein
MCSGSRLDDANRENEPHQDDDHNACHIDPSTVEGRDGQVQIRRSVLDLKPEDGPPLDCMRFCSSFGIGASHLE